MTLNLKSETLWISIIFVSVAIAFSGSLRGEFVYDDRRQIVANPLIQDPDLYAKALTSDVWAFKGDGTIAASNYWRPVFTAWCILNFLLFGLDPFGWHLANLILHAGVCIIAYLLLRRWNVSQKIALAISLIFAVHPVHTESVAWISGSPDILVSLFILLALLFADFASTEDRHKSRNIAIAVVLYLLALGSKEVAVFCAPIFLLVLRSRDEGESQTFPVGGTVLFFGAAALFFSFRWVIIGRLTHPVPDSPSITDAFLSFPSIFVFYLQQIVWPSLLGPSYAIRPIESIGVLNFVCPLVITLGVLAGGFLVSSGSFVRRIGLALFVLPLLPAFGITAFPSDQIVHDRYLYLPLLGFSVVLITWVSELLARKMQREKSELVTLATCVALAILLCFQTVTYRRVWTNELALWNHAVKIDEASATNWMQLGAENAALGNFDASAIAYERSLSIKQDPLAVMGSSRVAIARGNIEGAVLALENVVSTPSDQINAYTLFQSYETLAVAYQQQKNYSAAERSLRSARERLPIYRATLTEKLAVMLYLQDRKREALAELESVRDRSTRELLPASKLVLFRLGMLYNELGRREEAKAALEKYLTTSSSDAAAAEDRKQAAVLLRSIR